jgi:hypothetical protein
MFVGKSLGNYGESLNIVKAYILNAQYVDSEIGSSEYNSDFETLGDKDSYFTFYPTHLPNTIISVYSDGRGDSTFIYEVINGEVNILHEIY